VLVTGWEHSAKDTSFPLNGVPVSSTAVRPIDPCLWLTNTLLLGECSAGFLVEFSPEFSIAYSTFLGVSASEANLTFPIVQGPGMALDSELGYAYVAGLAGGSNAV
jgi:hypothetical protein